MPSVVLVLLCGLVGLLGFYFVRHATNDLFSREARLESTNWSTNIQRNAGDLVAVARGSAASPETLRALERSQAAPEVLAIRVYDDKGNMVLRVADSDVADVAAATADLADALRSTTARTFVHEGENAGTPAYLVTTLLPIRDGDQISGWLAVDIDKSQLRALFQRLSTRISLVVGALLMIGPLLGFLYRTRQKSAVERHLQTLAQRDLLTGLPNTATFLKIIDAQLAAQDPQAGQCALISCEITDIDLVEQNFGRQAAEQAILDTSERLAMLKPQNCELGSLGRARFGLIINGVTDAMSVLALAKDLTSKLSVASDTGSETTHLQIHAGISLSSTDGADAASLSRSAELALHSAQEQGTPGYGFFNAEIAGDARRRVAVQRAVADAVTAQSFRLDFQPIYSIRTGELNGFEALIRLHDAELGAVSPAEFIPIAEQAGLINRIGAWCLQEACRVAAQWPPHLVVSVNLSPAQFYSGSLISDVHQALQESQFPAYRLEVEITEGTLLKDSEIVLQQLGVLREMGLAVALDDFGTGYSSLSYLWKFPFSKLKIDRSFVWALDETQSAKGILRSIIKLGHGLGLTITAEGIENAKQLATLRDLGCDLAQGYLLDRPARVSDLAGIILRNFAKGLQRRGRDQLPDADSAEGDSSAA